MIITFFTAAAVVTTLAGGMIAFKFKNSIHYLLGTTAGIILAVVCFELFPEIFELATELNFDLHAIMIFFLVGFLGFHIVEKSILLHHHSEEDYQIHHHPVVGKSSAIALAVHSLFDGMAIGLAFQISVTAGVAVSVAVLAHKFSDGINTVAIMLAHKNTTKEIWRYLAISSIMPAVGVILVQFINIKDNIILYFLSIMTGVLFYICASDVLPEAHSNRPRWGVLFATIVSVALMYFVFELLH